jgi:adenine phosphoribosyltransferase
MSIGEAEESSYIVAKLLNSLKEVYTFKELEEILDMPSQLLWRYTTFSQFPERQTAKKILDAIRENRLIEKALKQALSKETGVAEEWRLLFNPRILNLVGYLAWKHFKDDEVNLVMTAGEKNSALAVVLAEWLSADACVATEHAWTSWGKFFSAPYNSSEREEYVYLHVPKEAIKRDSRILFVKGTAKNFESLSALYTIAGQAKAVPVGGLVVLAYTDKWTEFTAKTGIKKFYVVASLRGGQLIVSI